MKSMKIRQTSWIPIVGALMLAVACSSGERSAEPAQDSSTAQPATAAAQGTEQAVSQQVKGERGEEKGERREEEGERRASPSVTASRNAPTSPAEAAPRSAARSSSPAGATTRRPASVRVARTISVPEGTTLPLSLTGALASNTSSVEDRVTARLADDVVVRGEAVLPEGSVVSGRVTYVDDGGKVKGRAALTVRFYTITIGERTYDIAAAPVRREARGTKGKDAQKIGIGAGAGAVVGGLLGGRKGAAIGAAAGGAGGTGVVLATRGEQVALPAGTRVTTSLTESLVVDR